MILIDSLYINNGGGKILLDYLIEELAKTNLKITYLIDNRIVDFQINIPEHQNVVFLEASMINRAGFYRRNKNKFSKVLCFGNIPPIFNTKSIVYTYFHQYLFLELPKDLPFLSKQVFKAKIATLKLLKKNTNFWIVQSELVKSKLDKQFKIGTDKILVLPFYPPFESEVKTERKAEQYLYVSNGPDHKNHIRLINAFCKFYIIHKKGNLILTVGPDFENLHKLIKEKISLGFPIENVGFIEREKLKTLYLQSMFMIYPSLSESLGLSIVESIENGCNIIASNLDYTFAACKPSIVFDPFSEDSIFDALEKSIQGNLDKSYSKIKNEINEIIRILQ